MKADAIDVHLGQSAIWLRLALCIHLFAAFIPFFSSVGFLSVGIWPVIGCSFFYLLRRDYLRNAPSSIQSLRFYDGEWKVQVYDGEWQDAQLKGERLITPFLTALSFRVQVGEKAKCWRVVIFRDAVAPEPYRRLRVQLLLGS